MLWHYRALAPCCGTMLWHNVLALLTHVLTKAGHCHRAISQAFDEIPVPTNQARQKQKRNSWPAWLWLARRDKRRGREQRALGAEERRPLRQRQVQGRAASAFFSRPSFFLLSRRFDLFFPNVCFRSNGRRTAERQGRSKGRPQAFLDRTCLPRPLHAITAGRPLKFAARVARRCLWNGVADISYCAWPMQ